MNKVLSLDIKRRFQVYGVGAGRSGSRSMVGIFSSCYRSAHEPYSKELIAIILALRKGLINERDFRKYIIYLDNKLELEFNSSFLNNWQLDVLVAEFPNAKFILTIRDCYSWLNSFINALLFQHSGIPSENRKFLNMLFGKETYRHAKEEKVLYEKGLYTLDGFLSYWARVNTEILATVPGSRILIVKTSEISRKTEKIADFIGISSKALDLSKSHLCKSVKYPNILATIDRDFLSSKVDLHCKELMDKFFPGFEYTYE